MHFSLHRNDANFDTILLVYFFKRFAKVFDQLPRSRQFFFTELNGQEKCMCVIQSGKKSRTCKLEIAMAQYNVETVLRNLRFFIQFLQFAL